MLTWRSGIVLVACGLILGASFAPADAAIIVQWHTFPTGLGSSPSFSANVGSGTLSVSAFRVDTGGPPQLTIGGTDSNLDFSFSTTGYANVVFTFDLIDRTSNAMTTGVVSASTTALPGSTVATIDFADSANAPPKTFSFSISALNDSSTALIRLALSGGSGSDTIQFDNFTVTGDLIDIPEPSQLVLVGLVGMVSWWRWRRRKPDAGREGTATDPATCQAK